MNQKSNNSPVHVKNAIESLAVVQAEVANINKNLNVVAKAEQKINELKREAHTNIVSVNKSNVPSTVSNQTLQLANNLKNINNNALKIASANVQALNSARNAQVALANLGVNVKPAVTANAQIQNVNKAVNQLVNGIKNANAVSSPNASASTSVEASSEEPSFVESLFSGSASQTEASSEPTETVVSDVSSPSASGGARRRKSRKSPKKSRRSPKKSSVVKKKNYSKAIKALSKLYNQMKRQKKVHKKRHHRRSLSSLFDSDSSDSFDNMDFSLGSLSSSSLFSKKRQLRDLLQKQKKLLKYEDKASILQQYADKFERQAQRIRDIKKRINDQTQIIKESLSHATASESTKLANISMNNQDLLKLIHQLNTTVSQLKGKISSSSSASKSASKSADKSVDVSTQSVQTNLLNLQKNSSSLPTQINLRPQAQSLF